MSAARRGTAFAAAALLGLLGACSSPELVCTYETFELCQSAGKRPSRPSTTREA